MSDALETSTKPAKPRVRSAARTIDILQAVARGEATGISAREISEQLGLPRQVVYHLVHTLVGCDMLRKVGGNNYVLGLGMATLAHSFRRQMSTSDSLGGYAERASRSTGETAYVVGWVDDEIVVLETARGSAAIQAAEVSQGTAGEAHARASGKLLLAMSTDADVARYLAANPLNRRTPNTIAKPDAFTAELERIRGIWVSHEREEYSPGLSCMAVPIGRVPSRLALGISAPSERFEEHLAANLELLRTIANG